MLFGLLNRVKYPPLTTLCRRVSEQSITKYILTTDGTSEFKRAQVLFMLVMLLSAKFINILKWDENGLWMGSRRYLRGTNLDVITAETIVWITFLMSLHWRADQKLNPEMFSRVGLGTIRIVNALAISTIKSETGFDFSARATESRRAYIRSEEDGIGLVEAFSSIVLRSVGCRSLADSPKTVGPMPPPELTPINLSVIAFYTTMPLGAYETFKNMLEVSPFHFPRDHFGD